MADSKQTVFSLQGVVARSPWPFAEPIDLEMTRGEHWALIGRNGAGKTMLTEIIKRSFQIDAGRLIYHFDDCPSPRVCDNVASVRFSDQYGEAAEAPFYQLRWNQGLLDDSLVTVRQVLERTAARAAKAGVRAGMDGLGVDDLLDKLVIMLSSGEFRRFQLARVLVKRPRVLILDQPFIGLDRDNRAQVATFLDQLAAEGHTQLIVCLCAEVGDALPLQCLTHSVEVADGRVRKAAITPTAVCPQSADQPLVLAKGNTGHQTGEEILRLHDITIRYGERTILQNLDWTVHRGEKWALKGPNGSGKSTLLSLVCADNPQGYACDITFFGRRRGTGESIWDIKRHIGYVSPEMYRSYRKALPVKAIMASGLYDTVGLYRQPKEADYAIVAEWLDAFGLGYLAERTYTELSEGQQRMVLLARAFVKRPQLLILDEPFHGLDARNLATAQRVLDGYLDGDKTLIMVSHYDEFFPKDIDHVLELKKQE